MKPIAHEPLARQQLTNRIGELAGALDGFPVQALLTDCLQPPDAHGAGQTCKTLLIDRVLNQWIDRLGHDIEQLPPTTIDVLKAISQRTHATRDALIEVRRLFDHLADGPDPAAVVPAARPHA